MTVCYEFKIKLQDFAYFLIKIANSCNYELFYENDTFYLELNDSEEKILEFNEKIKKIPYFLFLEDFSFSLEASKNRNKFIPKDMILEHNLCDEIFNDLSFAKTYEYEKVLESEFCLVANLELLNKAFELNKDIQILLNSYEKPFIKLKVKSLYKKAHNLNSYLYVAVAKNKELFNELKDSNELYFIKKPENPLIINSFNDDFAVINNPYTKEVSKAFDIDKLEFNLPKNKAELIKQVSQLEKGSILLDNYFKKYEINEFELLENNIFGLIKLAGIILNKNILDEVPKTYTKGLRIDFVIDENGLNIAKLISSILSFKLADAKMIEIGFFEGLVAMLGKINPNEREICTKLMEYQSFLNYSTFLNKHLKFSKWANCECFN